MAIKGLLKLSGGDTIEISDANIVQGSVSITMSACTSSFLIGTFNAAMLKIGIKDDEALEHEFDNASIKLREEKGENTTYLGTYWVDGTKTKRQKNAVMLTAQDASAAFDKTFSLSRETSFTPLSLVYNCCQAAGVAFYTSTNFSEFPNTSINVMASSASIQTYRDAVMWAAQIMCCNAVINRDGALELRRARYRVSGSTANVDFEISASDRKDIQFSDTRTWIKTLTAYSANEVKDYFSNWVPHDLQARAGSLTLMMNPLMNGKTAAECDTINNNWVQYTNEFIPRQITAQLFSNSAIKLGDTLGFTGGKIDVRRRIIGTVTYIKWVYHGTTTVRCDAPRAERGD